MDVAYVYRNTVSQELVYSIKSLKNIEYDRIFVCGDKPNLVGLKEGEGVFFIDVPQQTIPPYANVNNKLKEICKSDISDDFIFMNDDYFMMKPTELKIYNRGSLDDHIRDRRRNDMYSRALLATNHYLKLRHLPIVDYELHTPFIFNKHKLLELLKSIPRNSRLLIRSLYGNTYKVKSEFSYDCKNPANYMDRIYLSTNEGSFMREPIGEYIRSMLD